jgi:hypothetical protein
MRNYAKVLFLAVVAVCLSFSVKLHAQNGGNCTEGGAIGQAHATIASCIAGYGSSYEVTYYAYANQYGGYTVSVFAAPKCRPGQFCPLYIFLIATVETDANCTVVSATSPCR